jgi:hypothetical protein
MELTCMWKSKVLIIGFILFFAGCQSSEVATPTPFPPTPDNLMWMGGGSSITPVPAVLADVMANPEFYEGAYLQVTGQYFRRPLQVCGMDPHPSPAGWELVSGEIRVPAGGFNPQLRQLLPDGLTMTVIGRFSYWEGPVGCGKQAVPTEMWYLNVVKLIDPAQLARVTLTPSGGDVISDDIVSVSVTPDQGAGGGSTPVGEGGIPTSPPVAPPINTTTPTREVPIETLAAGFTPVSTPTTGTTIVPTAAGTQTANGTAVSSGTGTAVASGTASTTTVTPGTSTVTNTPPPGATMTPTPENNTTPVATATTGSGGVTNKGEPFVNIEFEMSELADSEIHEWSLPLDVEDKIIVSVIGEPAMNMAVKILDQNLNELLNQNNSPAGAVESVSFTPPSVGIYKFQITNMTNAQAGAYIMTYSIDAPSEYKILPQGQLLFDTQRTSTILVDELHYWFFKANGGDIVDLEVSSEASANLLLSLYTSDGNDVGDYFLVEELEAVEIPETGWYVLEFEEWGLDENDYQLTLSKQ